MQYTDFKIYKELCIEGVFDYSFEGIKEFKQTLKVVRNLY